MSDLSSTPEADENIRKPAPYADYVAPPNCPECDRSDPYPSWRKPSRDLYTHPEWWCLGCGHYWPNESNRG